MIIQFVIFVDETIVTEIIVEYFDNLKNNRTNPYRIALWNRLLLLLLLQTQASAGSWNRWAEVVHTRALRVSVNNLLAFQSVRAKKSRLKNNVRSAVNGETTATIVGKKFITEVSIDSSKSPWPIDGSEDKAKNFGERRRQKSGGKKWEMRNRSGAPPLRNRLEIETYVDLSDVLNY